MNPFRKKSDREFVDSLRRNERFRRPAGVALIVLGLAIVASAWWGVVRIERKVLLITNSLREINQPPRADLDAASAMLAYSTGLHSGLLIAQGGFFGALCIGLGFRLRFGGRTERLLIRYFDMAHEQTLPPQAP